MKDAVVEAYLLAGAAGSSTNAAEGLPFGCNGDSLEDGDGLFTCTQGYSTIGTYTPSGGPGNACPTAKPN